MESVKNLKKEIRLQFIDQRNRASRSSRKKWSADACDKLIEIILSHNPSVIHSFIPFGSEINILPFLQSCLGRGIKIIIPKIMRKPLMRQIQIDNLHELVVTKFGTKEPVDGKDFTGTLDLILVPGLAFSTDGFRIGYGGGYYDHFLSNQRNALKVGVGFPFQLVENLPHESHDVPLNQLILGDSIIQV